MKQIYLKLYMSVSLLPVILSRSARLVRCEAVRIDEKVQILNDAFTILCYTYLAYLVFKFFVPLNRLIAHD
jgi:hypothetical protein